MSSPRQVLRNRKTREEFMVSSFSLTPISKHTMFARPINYESFEKFLQEFQTKLPSTISATMQAKILSQLRQEYAARSTEITDIIKNPQAFTKLIIECREQIAKTRLNADALSLSGFLKLLGTSLIHAKLNTLFPGLALLTSLIPAIAAQRAFIYHQGHPASSEDLCADALYKCIQGYLTQEGQPWQNDLPQIAGLVERNSTDIDNCITHQTLENILARAYRGPNEFAANCTVTAPTNNDGTLMINATNMDSITCDIVKDSLIGLGNHCPLPPPQPSPPTPNPTATYSRNPLIGLGVGGLVVILAFGMYLGVEYARKHSRSAYKELE